MKPPKKGGIPIFRVGTLPKLLLIGLAILVAALLLLGLLVAGVGFYFARQKAKHAQLTDTRDLKARIDLLAQEYLERRPQAGLVIGVTQRGVRHIKGYGRVNETNAAPPDAATLFEIGSVTKVFTAIVLAKMSAEGRLKLDDPISRFLPPEAQPPPKDGPPITLAHLATHSSGLPRLPDNLFATATDENNPYANYRAADLYQYLARAKLAKTPGQQSEYSNLGYGLLGHILARHAGTNYEALVKDMLCQPLGMENTTITLSDAQRRKLTPGHDTQGRVVSGWDFDVMAPAGAFRSNAEDLLQFLEANLATADTPLAQALRETHQPHFKHWTGDCGLGWQMMKTLEDLNFLWHNGGTGGYVSFVGFDPAHQTGVVVLSNYGDAMAGNSAVDKMAVSILKLASKVSL